MGDALQGLSRRFDRYATWVAGWGALIIVVQMLWITYGVIVRYGLNAPDRLVTEATALLLFPVAFAGLAYALKEDAYPKVTIVVDRFSPRVRRFVDIANLIVMLVVSGFFAIAAIRSTLYSFESGAASEILGWPRYLFWVQGAIALVAFFLYALLKMLVLVATPVRPEDA
jgi:TRAP-type C4-dicarboxylate transport system permease small subunit